MRVLVTGSREWPWTARTMIQDELEGMLHDWYRGLFGDEVFTLVHGACPEGADKWAHQWARDNPYFHDGGGAVEESHPAEWSKYGKRAGPLRNQKMVDLGADICLAYRMNESSGTTDCMTKAYRAGIRVVLHDLRVMDVKL